MMLLQIADVLGKDCGARLREAIKTMTGDDHMDNNELLLGDIASILLGPQVMVDDPPKPIGEGKYVFSGDLCELISNISLTERAIKASTRLVLPQCSKPSISNPSTRSAG